MRIGIITEGRKEIEPLKKINSKITMPSKHIIIGPIYASVYPKATPQQIAKSAESAVKVLIENKKINKILILLDYEDQTECVGIICQNIEKAFQAMGYKDIYIVIKKKKFENWLISDLDALKKMPRRFNITKTAEKRIAPNKADHIDGLKEIEALCNGKAYDKNKDGNSISEFINPLNVALNSRSFRKYLRLLGHSTYIKQSKNP